MIVSPDLYSSQGNGTMNCSLQQFDAGRHSVFSSLSVEPHWMSHRSPLVVKQEPREETDFSQFLKEDKTTLPAPLTPPGLPNNYSFPTPPQPDYNGSPQQDFAPGSSNQAPSPPLERNGISHLTPPSPSPTGDPDPKGDHQDNSQSSGSENEFYENGDSLRRLQIALQRTGMMSEEKLTCPMCDFFCSVRSQFNEHLMSHETKCTACDFNADTSEKLKEHMKTAHDILYEDESWGDDEPGLNTPKVNSQGKVKTFRCKQCEFCAVTKLEFWEHSRSHIKQERLLTCPKCPFVTEYKHHLEYHLRNHFGSKPFKCDKCSYSCVNKSMLNSHLKSHSNVYQFRCSDCTYATKYCHSLKLHLRKYGHNPAMVLNPDGSPNPLPIVDVYGTRRGPKQKQKAEKAQVPVPPVFNPYSLLPAQMPYYNILNGFGPFPFPQVEEKNNNIEKEEVQEDKDERAPLDLTWPEQSESNDDAGETSETTETPVAKNRRKGKAFKLDRIRLQLQEQESDEDDEEPEPKHQKLEDPKSPVSCKSPEVKSCEADSEQKVEKQKIDEYNCTYCDISFKDIVMYTMHMGYHGYQDPFTCNMCGQQTTDKVSFFLHIARTSHS